MNSGASGNRVGTDGNGTSDSLESNVISGNGSTGVTISDAGTSGNVVAGNFIGVDAAGTAALTGNVSWLRAEGNANDSVTSTSGTLVNGATYAPGKVGQAFSLNGVNQYVSVPQTGSQQLTNDFTVEAWANPSTVAGQARIFAKGISANSGYSLGRLGDRIRFTTFGVRDYDTVGSYFVAGTWTHVAVVLDANNTAHFYVNGSLVESITHTAPARVESNPIIIGSISGNTQFWTGLIDEVGIYNRSLTAAEIAGIASAGSAGRFRGNAGPASSFRVARRTTGSGRTATV